MVFMSPKESLPHDWTIDSVGFRRLCAYLRGEHPPAWRVEIRRRWKKGVAGAHRVRGGQRRQDP